MFELTGKYGVAKIFTDTVDQEAVAQVIELCNQPFAQGSRIRMMPDIHAGDGCTVGTTMTVTGEVAPALVGSDIGCGMLTVFLKDCGLHLPKLDRLIREQIPAGASLRKEPHPLLPQATSSTVGSSHFIIFAVSAAFLPYSPAVCVQICQSPSISFPRHHVLIWNGSEYPCFRRKSE